jgi:hypothetical protein
MGSQAFNVTLSVHDGMRYSSTPAISSVTGDTILPATIRTSLVENATERPDGNYRTADYRVPPNRTNDACG